MTLYESIFSRKSIRNFQMEELSEQILNDIKVFEKELMPFNKRIKTEIEIINSVSENKRIKGMFSVRAPYYLALYSEEAEEDYINAGFILEQMVLYLHMRGLGTCYLGNGRTTDYKEVRNGCRFVIVAAFGYPRGTLSRRPEEAKRLELADLCVFRQELSRERKVLLDAARIAPSSMNSQPWRFVVYENRIHVFLQKNRLFSRLTRKWNRIDMGIVLSHLMLAADELWLDAIIEKKDNISNKQVPDNEYIASILWK